jgi:nicotinamide-nucleotide amidase
VTSETATDAAVGEFARRVKSRGLTVAVAESLTCGKLASTLGAAGEASEWFRGGVVAYSNEVKFDVLGVSPGPVITASCARQLAAGAQAVLGADLAISATGVGGPGSEEGKPQGTVYTAVALREHIDVREWHFEGEPDDVLRETLRAAVEQALAVLDGH